MNDHHISSADDADAGERPNRVTASERRTPRPTAEDAARQLEQLRAEVAALSANDPLPPQARDEAAPEARRSGMLSRLFHS